MAEMDPVEIADGGDATPVVGPQIVLAANQFHGSSQAGGVTLRAKISIIGTITGFLIHQWPLFP